MTGLDGPSRAKNSSTQHIGRVKDSKNEEEGGLIPLPSFSLIIQQQPTKFLGWHPLACPRKVVKNAIGIFIGIAIALGRMGILTILIFPMHERGMFSYLFVSS